MYAQSVYQLHSNDSIPDSVPGVNVNSSASAGKVLLQGSQGHAFEVELGSVASAGDGKMVMNLQCGGIFSSGRFTNQGSCGKLAIQILKPTGYWVDRRGVLFCLMKMTLNMVQSMQIPQQKKMHLQHYPEFLNEESKSQDIMTINKELSRRSLLQIPY